MTRRILFFAALLGITHVAAADDGSKESLPAPPFRVVTLDEDTLSSTQLRGRVLVLDFWHIGCLPCVSEISGLNQLTTGFQNEDVVFISFVSNAKKPLARFLRQRPFYYHQVPHAQSVAHHYGIHKSPTHIVISPQGQILYRIKGGSLTTASKLRKVIEKALDTKDEK